MALADMVMAMDMAMATDMGMVTVADMEADIILKKEKDFSPC